MDASLVTPAGLEKFTAELELLRSKRDALRERIKAGAEVAGVRGSFVEHLDAPDELARLERQIALLDDRLAAATVVQPDPADGELGVGESARLRDLDSGELVEYRLVGAGEADPAAGSISYTSPVGSALFGRQVGDVIEVEVPSGLLRLEILRIQI
jgi:transcription elongation factor GreA